MEEEALLNRKMPCSREAEEAVIGSMIMDRDAVITASEMLRKEDFYYEQYGILFEAIQELYNEGKEVDLVTLQNRLREKNVPPEVSSLDYVKDLYEASPVSSNVKNYAQIVAEKALLRRLIRASQEIENECYAQKDGTDEILDRTEKNIFGILQHRSAGEYVPIRQIVVDALDRIGAAGRARGGVTGIPTGFNSLDYKLSGLQPSDLILIAARPSMGKTAFALNIAQYTAIRKNLPTAVFSLEMSKEQLVNRLLSQEASVNAMKLRNGNLSDSEWDSLMAAAASVAEAPLIIDDTPGISVPELRSRCRKYKLEHDLKLIIVDYLQLMSVSSRKIDSRQQEISEISRSLKQIARELKIPVIALSQLSRAVEQRPEHRPMLSDLRESGAIEQDADVVMFLYRDDYYNKDTEKKDIAEVIIAKQRNGPIGTVELQWQPEYTRFQEIDWQSGGQEVT